MSYPFDSDARPPHWNLHMRAAFSKPLVHLHATHHVQMDLAPDATRARKLRALEKAESLAMLQDQLLSSRASDHAIDSLSPMSLRISLRRVRLALLVAFTVVVVVALTLVFSHGAELRRFDGRTVSTDELSRLLDSYNSYSGTVTSAFARPLEIFVAIIAQVVVLLVMADSVLAVEQSWRVKLVVLTLGATVGFLLTNGFNAMNVQVRELPVTAVMSASDLSVQVNATGTSTVTKTLPETAPKNPSVNTILRNLMLPRAANLPRKCTQFSGGMADDTVVFGVPQRAWMKNLLPQALETTTMRVDLLSNKTTLQPRDFPIDATTAADLLIAGVYTTRAYAPFSPNPFVLGNDSLKVFRTSATHPKRVVPTARLAGLLPPDEASTETQDREWFLRRSAAFVRGANSDPRRESSLRWTMELTRVNITPSVWVDAVTLVSEVQHDAQKVDNATRTSFYTRKFSFLGPSTAMWFVPRPADDQVETIDAFAVCVNANGTETLHSTLQYGEELSASTVSCNTTSTSAMYFFSSGKRLVADAILTDLKNESSVLSNATNDDSVVKNLRIVYTSTFARIHWHLRNLSDVYGAACEDRSGSCMGLDAALSEVDQRLLVSANALPVDQLSPILLVTPTYVPPAQSPLTIASVRRPTIATGYKDPGGVSENMVGDILLPHNVKRAADFELSGDACAASLEKRAQLYVNNHVYMETTLQATYTAATFFLFQNAVAKDVLPQDAASSDVLLRLDENVLEMSVRLSIPRFNAILTLVGCVLLVATLVLALFSQHLQSRVDDPLRHVQTPHVVARVMVDDTTFPALLLKRHVTHHDGEGDAEQLLIDALSVRPFLSEEKEAKEEGTVA